MMAKGRLSAVAEVARPVNRKIRPSPARSKLREAKRTTPEAAVAVRVPPNTPAVPRARDTVTIDLESDTSTWPEASCSERMGCIGKAKEETDASGCVVTTSITAGEATIVSVLLVAFDKSPLEKTDCQKKKIKKKKETKKKKCKTIGKKFFSS